MQDKPPIDPVALEEEKEKIGEEPKLMNVRDWLMQYENGHEFRLEKSLEVCRLKNKTNGDTFIMKNTRP